LVLERDSLERDSVPTLQKIGVASEFYQMFCNTSLGDAKVFLLLTANKGIY